jgi:hypothetical protein
MFDSGIFDPKAVHWTAHAGVEIDWLPPRSRFFERHGVYAELTVLDSYLFAYFDNPEAVRFSEIVSSGFGYRAAL